MAEKPTIAKIHLLVHPFYGNIEAYNYKPYPTDPKRYEKTLSRQWGNLIKRIRDNPNEVLVYVPYALSNHRADRLLSFARRMLKQRLIITTPGIISDSALFAIQQIKDMGKIDPAQVKLESHGEMSHDCVYKFTNHVANAIGNAELMQHAHDSLTRLVHPKPMPDARVVINPETTENLSGKEKYIRKHLWKKPKVRPARKNTLRKARYRDGILPRKHDIGVLSRKRLAGFRPR